LVLIELDRRNPVNEKGIRKHRFHQDLNEERGLRSLRAMIWQVIGILKTSAGKRQFERAYARLRGEPYQPSFWEE
jgi:hypothetical protein